MSRRLTPAALARLLRPGALALRLTVGGVAAALGMGAAMLPVLAQEASARRYDIPPGPLGPVLTRVVMESGVLLAASTALTQGKTSPGLRGRFTEVQALEAVLQGSGLEAVPTGGSYALRVAPLAAQPLAQPAAVPARAPPRPSTPVVQAAEPDPAPDLTALIPVHVNGRAGRETGAESSGRYTAPLVGSATRLDLTPRETPQSVTVVTRQMIEDRGLTTMEQVLAHTPGISLVGDASENSQVFARGFYLGTGILIDGLNATSAQPLYEGSISQGLDPVIAERIEVVKGASGLLAGLGEPSASVNFIRKRATRDIQAYAQVGIGRWGRREVEADVSGPLSEDGRIRARLVGAHREADSYIDRHETRRQVLYGTVEADLTPRTLLTLALDEQRSDVRGAFDFNSNPAFFRDGGAFDGGTSFSTGQRWSTWQVRARGVQPALEHRFDGGWRGRVALRVATADIDRVSFYPGDTVDRATGDLIGDRGAAYANRSLRHSRTDSVDAYLTGQFELLGRRHELVLGGSFARNDFGMASFDSAAMPSYNIASGAVAPPTLPDQPGEDFRYDQRQSGVYATLRLALTDTAKLLAGARVNRWRHTTTDRLKGDVMRVSHDGIVTPYLGAVVDLSDALSVYASYTGSFRPVNYFGESGRLLDPIIGSNVEAGVKWSAPDEALNASLAVYLTKEDNEPEFAGQGQLASGEWIYRSLGQVRTTGVELELSGRPTPWLDIAGGFTRNRARDAQGLRKLTYLPESVLKLSASVRVGDALSLGGALRWQSAGYRDLVIATADWAEPAVAARQRQAAYALVDLSGRYRISERLSAAIHLDNLLDKRYSRSLWGYADHGEPRDLRVSMRMRW